MTTIDDIRRIAAELLEAEQKATKPPCEVFQSDDGNYWHVSFGKYETDTSVMEQADAAYAAAEEACK